MVPKIIAIFSIFINLFNHEPTHEIVRLKFIENGKYIIYNDKLSIPVVPGLKMKEGFYTAFIDNGSVKYLVEERGIKNGKKIIKNNQRFIQIGSGFVLAGLGGRKAKGS